MSNTRNSSTFEDYKMLLNFLVEWKKEKTCPFERMFVGPFRDETGAKLKIVLWWEYGDTPSDIWKESSFWDAVIHGYCFKYDYENKYFISTFIPIEGEIIKSLKKIEDISKEHRDKFETLLVSIPKDGCYVATAVYGSYDCPEVWTLRRFRDKTLAETYFGRLFIRFYYAVSPTAVKYFGNMKWFKNLFKKPLNKFVHFLNRKGFENTPYYDRQEETK